MQQRTTKEEYQKQVNIVIEYINNNLNEDLDLNTLTEKTIFSPFHFHRIMKSFLGESLGAFIMRVRVETAARLLRYTDLPIQDIAYQVGYDVPSSLSKVFKLFYNVSPTEFRNNKNYTIMRSLLLNNELNLKAPKIQEIESKQAIYIQIFGKYSDIDFCGSWNHLWQYVKENKLFSAGIEHLCVYHDDPKVTEADKLRTDICLVIPKKEKTTPNAEGSCVYKEDSKEVKAKGEIGVKEIRGGKFAVFTYQGSYEHMGSVYDTIYGKWLPESDCKLRNAPGFEKYLNNPDKTSPDKLKTEIYIPIE